MDEDLRRLLEAALRDINALTARLVAGTISPSEWHNALATLLGEWHTAAYLLGRDVQDLSPAARDYLLRTLGDQVDHMNGFTDDVEAGRLSDAQIKARAALYAGPLKATWSRAKWWDWPLPFHPADGETECLVNCGCRWEGKDLDVEQLDGDFYWILGQFPHAEHCPGCVERYDKGKPYKVRGGVLQ